MESRNTIREAVEGDAPAIAELLGELGYPSTVAFVTLRLGDLSHSPGHRVFVAVCEGETAGFLSFHIIPLFHSAESLGRVTALSVSPKFQRRRIGRMLIAAAEDYAWAQGCGRIEVTTSDHRVGAHAFYNAAGYREEIRRFIKHRPEVPTPGL